MISLELIPWEQMANGGLPTEDAWNPQELVGVHAARRSTEVGQVRNIFMSKMMQVEHFRVIVRIYWVQSRLVETMVLSNT